MNRKLILLTAMISAFTTVSLAQSDITITKRIQIKIPGMESMAASMPEATQKSLAETMNRTSNVYIKGSSMRTDSEYKQMGMTGFKKRIFTSIQQCGTGRTITFTDNKKKYHVDAPAAPTAKAKRGGYVTISLTVTDTGERTKLFGFDARRLKQTMVITPGENSCQKTAIRMDIDGWYADIPTFSCPMRTDVSSLQAEGNCFDDIVYDIKGSPSSGVALKETKTFSIEGQAISITEEVVDLVRTDLPASLFEAPAGYTPANTRAEAASENGN